MIPHEQRLQIYNTILLPTWDYGIDLWGSTNPPTTTDYKPISPKFLESCRTYSSMFQTSLLSKITLYPLVLELAITSYKHILSKQSEHQTHSHNLFPHQPSHWSSKTPQTRLAMRPPSGRTIISKSLLTFFNPSLLQQTSNTLHCIHFTDWYHWVTTRKVN